MGFLPRVIRETDPWTRSEQARCGKLECMLMGFAFGHQLHSTKHAAAAGLMRHFASQDGCPACHGGPPRAVSTLPNNPYASPATFSLSMSTFSLAQLFDEGMELSIAGQVHSHP